MKELLTEVLTKKSARTKAKMTKVALTNASSAPSWS